ncbi:DUF2249 domain-containing protein [Schaalia sp. ZJ405]|uniref:DUF2249 domain-containing protein n=1 Tax=Schaalia sp. ZJ405 TaxID=2709403 RepID=UPI0013ED859E|nr:DUF2249 domain-containing protein [Schaalia sp. ZJ405]QPK81367.1 DUF2249 domain-containing protein [Schaalia sp. ZJ405]
MVDTLPEAAPNGDHQTFKLVDAHATTSASGGGCGCGGHGHGEAEGHGNGGGCGCGGHGKGHGHGGGCGCGGHGKGHGHGHGHADAHPSETEVEELVVHSLPRIIRRALLFAAVDQLPVGENLVIRTPHQPDPLFEHLQQSESHYRVETLEAGPEAWRYRITRVS